MKKLVVLFLSACLLLPLGLVGCGGNEEPKTPGDNGGKPVGDPLPDDPADDKNPSLAVDPESLTVAGVDISQFTVVYAPSYDPDFLTEFEEFLGYDYEHNLETANELVSLLSDTLGVTLPVVKAGESEAEYEILVGRGEGLADDAYSIRVVGKKLAVTGGSDAAVYHALDAIGAAFAETTVADMVWADGFTLSGKAPIRRIACIGDSLTEGSIGGHVTPALAYPAALERLLWQDYVVYNYGLGGTTMMNGTASPYQSSAQYADCLSSGLSYDLILVMLGTNDSKVIGDEWTADANDAYMTACETLFASLSEKSPDARFAFMNCPVKFTAAGYGNAYMLPVQKEAAQKMKDAGYDITHYDMRAYTTEVLAEGNFRDGLHPDYAGYALIAEGVLELVYHLEYGDENAYIIPLD